MTISHNVGLKVVAKGIERVEELELLSQYGCDIAQGYYICEPLAGDELLGWYETTVQK